MKKNKFMFVKMQLCSFQFCCLSVLLLLLGCKTEVKPTIENEAFVMSSKMMSTTKMATAEMAALTNQLNFYGNITADNNKMIEVFPVVGGYVTRVYVELGDYVQKGQLLATIKSTEVAGFEQESEDAKNDLTIAQNRLRVAKELFEGKLNTEREVIEAKGELNKAQSRLNRVRETYRVYNIKPNAIYEVRAPMSGFILQKNINQDMLLRSDKSDNIFDIAQIDEVWAMANVSESDIGLVKMGIDAEITTLSYPDKKFYGKVDKISNIIDPETKAMKARVKLNNVDFLLKPDMRATIKLSYTEDQKMIAIPASALIFDKSKTYVMVFKNRNNILTRKVEVFRQVGDIAYISSGLKQGERVLRTNQLLIYDALND